MTFIADIAQAGVWPLRSGEDLPPSVRTAVFGVRIASRDAEQSYETADAGDINHALHWLADPAADRAHGEWAFAVPALYGREGRADVAGTVYPIREKPTQRDRRFVPMLDRMPFSPRPDDDPETRDHLRAQYVETLHGRWLPDHTPGIVLAGSEEREQKALFAPTGLGVDLICDHGTPAGLKVGKFSTVVHAMDGDKTHPMLHAGLNSAWRVVLLPEAWGRRQPRINRYTDEEIPQLILNEGALAWNLLGDENGLSATGWGLVAGLAVDVESGTVEDQDGRNESIALAFMASSLKIGSTVYGGPLSVGSRSDKHTYGLNRKGVPLNAGHIDVGAHYHLNSDQDGPLEFDFRSRWLSGPQLPIAPSVDFFWWPVSLRYGAPTAGHFDIPPNPDGKLWSWRTFSPFAPPKDPDHDLVGDDRRDPGGRGDALRRTDPDHRRDSPCARQRP